MCEYALFLCNIAQWFYIKKKVYIYITSNYKFGTRFEIKIKKTHYDTSLFQNSIS